MKQIYCIEGVYIDGMPEAQPSVRPFLEQLRSQYLWNFSCRDCATVGEFRYYLEKEWPNCDAGSILYISAHGFPEGLELSSGEKIAITTIKQHLADTCSGCLVRFSGCSVFANGDAFVDDFMDVTGAMGVSGYENDVGFLDYNWAPSIALELVMFGTIASEGINLNAYSSQQEPMRELKTKLIGRFPDCGLRMHFDFEK